MNDSHLCVSRWINEANRGPRLATQPENRPRRNQVAPVCHLYSAHCSRRRPPAIVACSSSRSADDACAEIRPRLELVGAMRSPDRRPPHTRPRSRSPRHPRTTRARRSLREGAAPNSAGDAFASPPNIEPTRNSQDRSSGSKGETRGRNGSIVRQRDRSGRKVCRTSQHARTRI